MGQVDISVKKHDFGDLESFSPRYVDVELKNVGNKQEWLLSLKKPREVIYIPSKQFIEKDSSIYVRFHVNPKAKGKFNYTIEVAVSAPLEPYKIKLTGNLLDVASDNNSAFTSCPTFTDRPAGSNPLGFDLTVITIDKKTKEVLSDSKVTLLQGGQPIWAKKTDKNGRIKEEATLGFSYFYAKHEGYYPAEKGAYVNASRDEIIIELDRDERAPDEPVVVAEEPVEEPHENEIVIEIGDDLEEDLATEIDTTYLDDLEVPASMEELADDEFGTDYFKAINVVFILDVSGSMAQGDKMELMKYSLSQLTDMLRPADKMGIVTYSSKAKVMLAPTSGANKEKIKEEVSSLSAYGYTSGGLGLKLGFKQAKKNKIEDGVNHVIIITDGGFNRNSKDYKRTVRKYKRQDIHLSVVGIKNKPVAEKSMKEAARAGGGHYVPIHKLADAQNNLKQEIRVLTYKFN